MWSCENLWAVYEYECQAFAACFNASPEVCGQFAGKEMPKCPPDALPGFLHAFVTDSLWGVWIYKEVPIQCIQWNLSL